MKLLLILFNLFFASTSLFAQQLPVYNIVKHEASSSSGYYFFVTNGNLVIMDKDAQIVYYKQGKFDFDFTMEPNGKMYFSTFNDILAMDSTFKVKDTIVSKYGMQLDPHDKLLMPNGHVLLLGTENLNYDLKNYPELKQSWKKDSISVQFAVLQEQDAQHNISFEWHAKDYFKLSDADTFFVNVDKIPEWTHSNSFALDADGNILLSSRNLCEITKINRITGAVMWRLGGKQNEFKFVNCPTPFYGQHDIKRIANGHISLLDNGDYKVPHGARAMEFDLDETNKTATLKWSYTYDSEMKSKARGNVQRLTNGNTLVSFGVTKGDSVCFVIVNPEGKKLFQVNGPSAYRVTNYPDLPFKLHRPTINCFDSAGLKYLDAGAGYLSYKWNSGETTRVIKLTKAGNYFVYIPCGDGGFISSEKYVVTDITKPCGLNPASIRKNKEIKKQ